MSASQIENTLKEAVKNPAYFKNFAQVLKQAIDKDGDGRLIAHKNGHIVAQLYQMLTGKANPSGYSHIEEILECISILSKTKEGCQFGFTHLKDLLTLFVGDSFNCSTYLELGQHINMLLSQLAKSDLTARKKEGQFDYFLESFETKFKNAGDYDVQANLTEAALRVVEPVEKLAFISNHFEDTETRESFVAIENQDFENGCRDFINKANATYAEDRSVYSIPCKSFHLGMYKLNAPLDQASREVWVDFNMGSRSITAFVNDDTAQETGETTWETVVIKQENVKDLRVTDSGEDFILILRLTLPASELTPFCPAAPEHYAKISFDKDLNMNVAVMRLFGEVRFVHLPRSSPTASPASVKASAAKMPFLISTGRGIKPKEAAETVSSKKEPSPPREARPIDKRPTDQSRGIKEGFLEQSIPGKATNVEVNCLTEKENGECDPSAGEPDKGSSEVIPETQEAGEKQPTVAESPAKIQPKKKGKERKRVQKTRTMKPRKAKAKAHSPFSFNENESEAVDLTDNDDEKSKEIGTHLGASFTDPRKPKRKIAKQTYGKRRSKSSKRLVSSFRKREQERVKTLSSSESDDSYSRTRRSRLLRWKQATDKHIDQADEVTSQQEQEDAAVPYLEEKRIDVRVKKKAKKLRSKKLPMECDEKAADFPVDTSVEQSLPCVDIDQIERSATEEHCDPVKSFALMSRRILDSASTRATTEGADEDYGSLLVRDEEHRIPEQGIYDTPKVVKNFRLKCDILEEPQIKERAERLSHQTKRGMPKERQKTSTAKGVRKQQAKRKRFELESSGSDVSEAHALSVLASFNCSDPDSFSNDGEQFNQLEPEETPCSRRATGQSRFKMNAFLGLPCHKMQTDAVMEQTKKNSVSQQRKQRETYAKEIDSMLNSEFRLVKKELEKQRNREDNILNLLLKCQQESVKSSTLQLKRLEGLENVVTLLSKRMIHLEEGSQGEMQN